jgi:hypothetical protein
MAMASLIGIRLLALALSVAGALAAPAFAEGGDACYRYLENRLVVGDDLQSRRFVLEAKGEVERMPSFRAAEGRAIFHRPFALSLDIVERVSLFESSASRTLVIARDRGRPAALQIPVFFLGRADESLEELQTNSENLVFAPSSSLDAGASFADVSFHLKRGGSRFSDIKPFFVCGMAGLLVCEQSCPEDSVTLAASLVNERLQPRAQPPKVAADSPKPEAPLPPPSSASPARERKPQATPPPAPPQPQQRVTEPAPARPAETKKPEAPPPAPPQPPQQQPAPRTNAPEPRREAQPPQTAPAQPAPEIKRLVLAFERKPGEPIPAEDVIKAEGDLSIEGSPMTQTPDGLAASVKDEVFQKAGDPDYLRRLFRHHRVASAKKEEGRIVLTVEPLYVRAEAVAIEILDANLEPVRGCDLALDVSAERRLGPGWAKLAAKERLRGLEYAETDTFYLLNQPQETEPNELLIGAAGVGNVARLSNTAPECELEPRPWLSAEEIRTGRIRRSLAKTGPILISIVSTESGFAAVAGFPAVESYWAEALKLINAVSAAPFEKKVLARAQAPGPNPATRVLQIAGEGALAAQDGRASALEELRDGSRVKPGPRSMLQTRPVGRFHVDLALKTIRNDASIPLRYSVGQETLLFISGTVEEDGSDFCQYSRLREKNSWVSPLWAKQARKAFALEIWSDNAVREMQKASRIKPANGAPDGVFACNVPGADGEKIALYGISPRLLPGEDAKAKAFAWLTERAAAFLKP